MPQTQNVKFNSPLLEKRLLSQLLQSKARAAKLCEFVR